MNIHDSGYKKLFSNHTIFRQLIETFVDEPWVQELDFSQAKTLDKSFVDDHYKETESDLIYQVGLQDRDVYSNSRNSLITPLLRQSCEHKSRRK